jgi:hypothetical protein
MYDMAQRWLGGNEAFGGAVSHGLFELGQAEILLFLLFCHGQQLVHFGRKKYRRSRILPDWDRGR